jgi:hypothetical protein
MRACPFLVFGPTMLVAFLVMMIFVTSSLAIVAATVVIGIAGAVSMTAILALPPFLSLPADVPRTAAGMFTISYTCAIIIPTICGALWDLTGKPWTAFVPLCLCAVALAVLGTVVPVVRPFRPRRASVSAEANTGRPRQPRDQQKRAVRGRANRQFFWMMQTPPAAK